MVAIDGHKITWAVPRAKHIVPSQGSRSPVRQRRGSHMPRLIAQGVISLPKWGWEWVLFPGT